MRTNLTSFKKTSGRLAAILFLAICSLAVISVQATPIITDVVETGGDNEATDTITAKWTGVTFSNGTDFPNPITVGLFSEACYAMVDRNHQYKGANASLPLPAYLVGGEYIMIGNDNRDNAALKLDITISQSSYVYVLIDNRVPATGDNNNANPPTLGPTVMNWVTNNGWVPYITGHNRAGSQTVPDEIGIDESADGSINQYFSVYRRMVPAGTFSTYEQNAGGINVYGVVVKAAVPPNTPDAPQAINADQKVVLSWTRLPNTSYYLKRSEVAGGPYTTILTNTSGSGYYEDVDVINDLTYYYVLSAFNDVGESANSAEVIGAPKAAPANVTTVGGTNQITLSWSTLAGAATYTVSRATVSKGPYTVVASGLTSPGYVDANLPWGARFYYVVTAQMSGGGDSGQSAEAIGITAPMTPIARAELFSATAAKVAWIYTNQVVDEFIVEKSFDGSSFSMLSTVSNTGRYYVEGALPPNLTTYYRVRAVNAAGPSDWSQVVSNTTPASGWNINFANSVLGQPANDPAPTPEGFYQDVGFVFGDQGNGLTYGWNIDNQGRGRWRKNSNSPDLRYDTITHMHTNNEPRVWEMQIPNGFYYVRIVAGDPSNSDSAFHYIVEGRETMLRIANTANRFFEFAQTVVVEDGALTLANGTTATNNKIAFVDIYPAYATIAQFQQDLPATIEFVQNRPLQLSVGLTNGPVPAGNLFYGYQPVSYQWYKDEFALTNTGSTLLIDLPQPSDSGGYYVVVSNYVGMVTSRVSQVTITPDTEGPKIVSMGSVDGLTIGVVFDELVRPESVIDQWLWEIAPGIGVTNAVARPDGKSAVLMITSDTPGQVPLTGEFSVTSTVSDMAGNGGDTPFTATSRVLSEWTSLDIGTNAEPSRVIAFATNWFEVQATGADIWNTADEMNFLSQPVTGDFDIQVRLESLLFRNTWTKAGLMAREDLDADSRHTTVIATPPASTGGQNIYQSMTRPAKAAGAAEVVPNLRPGPVSYPNTWLRLQKVGDSYISYYGTDGVNWTAFTTNTPSPAYTNVYVGLATTSHNDAVGQATVAVYRDLTLTTGGAAEVELAVPTLSGANVVISVPTQAGTTYTIQYKNALTDADWTTLQTLTGDGTTQTVTDARTNPMRFYRVRIP